ncbi:tRNA (guanine(10)-N(2))-dimethyltransferase [Methanosarcinaceae archaeon]|nr:tRNA (guanine(10)-N(2))-dimethyltransferase [Methanosarcinaceae archaeon]
MYQIIREGLTEIRIPVTEHPEGHPDVPLASSAVFYNPEMELNRDLNVIMTAAAARLLTEKKGYEKETFSYIDAFSASGIRGLRVAKELGIPVVLNDRKEEAAEMIRENVEINGLEKLSTVTCRDANSLLSDSRATFVDIDPFGTPSPFLDAAVSSASYYLGVTATDTAPLCGAHMKSGMRKYAAVPINNEFHSEMGLRILLGSIAREAARFEKGIHVLFSHATRHYVRCYIEMKHGVAQADRTVRELGFLAWCPKCGAREMKHGLAVFMDETCRENTEETDGENVCGGKRIISGPLWLGKLHDVSFCEEALSESEKLTLNKKEAARKLITVCMNEPDLPFFYDQHVICEQLRVSASSMELLLETLRGNGYAASRTHFSGTSFRTDAPLSEIRKIIYNLSPSENSKKKKGPEDETKI